MSRMGSTPDKGVSDMTCISDIDENGINRNLKIRYQRDEIYTGGERNCLNSYVFGRIRSFLTGVVPLVETIKVL
uniref:Uncharacterized protein n=1 Tax=Lutzomyia longipalpis TaxID=7200 RepID=A0A1B0CJ86_LUTLO